MKRVLLVEDVPDTRKWLGEMVEQAFDECEITETGSRREGLYAVEGHEFDLALIDLGLPDGSGLEVLQALQEKQPEAMAVVTTVMGEDSAIVSALSAGARGYLLKETPPDVIVAQLKQIDAGVPAMSPSIARRIMEHFRRTGPVEEAAAELTEREREVLGLVAKGLRNPEVAEKLGITRFTVASHVQSIYGKLGINTRAQASWHATRMGLTGE